jgi:hypothetical protein
MQRALVGGTVRPGQRSPRRFYDAFMPLFGRTPLLLQTLRPFQLGKITVEGTERDMSRLSREFEEEAV